MDGKSTPVRAAYLVGPVTTPPLNDGGGTHIIQLAAFLSPMTAGTHTVEIKGEFTGQAIQPTTFISEDITYMVHVG